MEYWMTEAMSSLPGIVRMLIKAYIGDLKYDHPADLTDDFYRRMSTLHKIYRLRKCEYTDLESAENIMRELKIKFPHGIMC